MLNRQNNRIGLFGGTFNPIHIGHLVIAQSAFEAYDLSKVVFIPCHIPPHKSNKEIAAAEHRKAMVEAAIEGDLRFESSDIEIRRSGISYSIDTVNEMKNIYPEAEFYFIIGSDTLPELHIWHKIDDLLKMCRFVAFQRPGFDRELLKKTDLRLAGSWAEKLMRDIRVSAPVDVSSSDIRYRIAEGMSIRYLVPHAVEIYLREHNLYRN